MTEPIKDLKIRLLVLKDTLLSLLATLEEKELLTPAEIDKILHATTVNLKKE